MLSFPTASRPRHSAHRAKSHNSSHHRNAPTTSPKPPHRHRRRRIPPKLRIPIRPRPCIDNPRRRPIQRRAKIVLGQATAQNGHILMRRPRQRISNTPHWIRQRFARRFKPHQPSGKRLGVRCDRNVSHPTFASSASPHQPVKINRRRQAPKITVAEVRQRLQRVLWSELPPINRPPAAIAKGKSILPSVSNASIST